MDVAWWAWLAVSAAALGVLALDLLLVQATVGRAAGAGRGRLGGPTAPGGEPR